MKTKSQLALFLLILIGNGYAQTLITDTVTSGYYKKYVVDDATGVKNGSYEMIYGGKILTKGTYKNGKRNGVWEFIGYNENIQQKGSYVDDLKDGEWQSYYSDGKLSCTMSFKMGKYDGVFKGVYPNGNTSFEKLYLNDLIHGTYTQYYMDGKVSKIQTYVADTLNGIVKEYYQSGILKIQKFMKGSLIDSLYSSYYENASIREKLMYKKGGLFNVISYLAVDGTKLDYGNLKDGTGTMRFYDITGKVISEEVFKNSLPEGYAKYYNKDGLVSREGNYVSGKRDGIWITNYITGELSSKSTYKNGELDGDAVDYSKSGPIAGKGKYENGKKSGLWICYDENGLLYSEINYTEGLMNGEAKYYRKGKISGEGKYNKGTKIYVWKTFDENGNETSVNDYGYTFVSKDESAKGKDSQTSYPPPPPPPVPGMKQQDEPQEDVFTITEQMPSFPGGIDMMMEFIRKNVVYPQMEKEANIQGTCYVTFVVDQVGEIKNVKILRGVSGGQGCDKESKRVVEMMPRWNPGMQSGRPVSVQFNLPIKYTLK